VGRFRNFKSKEMKGYTYPEGMLNQIDKMIQPTRTDLLNHLANKYQLKRFLEIGTQNPNQNFDKINCEYKVSVDPDPNAHATFCMTSDEFFDMPRISIGIMDGAKDQSDRFDLIFIDGLHTAEQVRKDFENALKVLSPNGFIVLHDCDPKEEHHTIVPRPTPSGHWHGDVYKFACLLSINKNFCTVEIDCGCGVFRGTDYKVSAKEDWTWTEFVQNRKKLLNLISWDEFLAL